jgi:hypothetical protein
VGSGSIAGPQGGQATFGMDVKFQKTKRGTKLVGNFSYEDSVSGVSIQTKRILSLSFNGNHAEFTGTARVSQKATVSFTVDVTGNGTPSTSDTFSIHLSNNYSAGGPLTGGDIQIR